MTEIRCLYCETSGVDADLVYEKENHSNIFCGSWCQEEYYDENPDELIGKKRGRRKKSKSRRKGSRLSKKQRSKFSRVMREFYAKKLKMRGGRVVTDPKQAKAIAYSKARSMK